MGAGQSALPIVDATVRRWEEHLGAASLVRAMLVFHGGDSAHVAVFDVEILIASLELVIMALRALQRELQFHREITLGDSVKALLHGLAAGWIIQSTRCPREVADVLCSCARELDDLVE